MSRYQSQNRSFEIYGEWRKIASKQSSYGVHLACGGVQNDSILKYNLSVAAEGGDGERA